MEKFGIIYVNLVVVRAMLTAAHVPVDAAITVTDVVVAVVVVEIPANMVALVDVTQHVLDAVAVVVHVRVIVPELVLELVQMYVAPRVFLAQIHVLVHVMVIVPMAVVPIVLADVTASVIRHAMALVKIRVI